MMKKRWCTGTVMLVLALGFNSGESKSAPVTWRLEAETYAADAGWTNVTLAGASGGRALNGARCNRFMEYFRAGSRKRVAFAEPGDYAVWVRYYKAKETGGGFYVQLRDETAEQIAVYRCHFNPIVERHRPYQPFEAPYLKATNFVWERFPLTVERPMTVDFALGACHSASWAAPVVDCLIVTADSAVDPSSMDAAALEKWPEPPEALAAGAAAAGLPPGYQVSTGLVCHTAFFSGADEPEDDFSLAMIDSPPRDYAYNVQLGFNENHNHTDARCGIRSTARASAYATLTNKYEKPEGRFVNAEGTVSEKTYSYCFPPLAEGLADRLRNVMKEKIDDPLVRFWAIAGEAGGVMDYSEYAQKAFREWLARKHGAIQALNEKWGTSFKTFDEVNPAKSPKEHLANWLEFRAFSGRVFAETVGRQIPIIKKLDPKKRPCIAQTSNGSFLNASSLAMHPIDMEEFIAVALAGESCVAWDTYCADDYLGCEYDLVRSLAPGRKLLVAEWNVHTPDPRIAVRTFWGVVGKGLQGMAFCNLQDGLNHYASSKWSLQYPDRTPKEKLAAFADAAHEIHRLEPLLLAARDTAPVKPVALYYSRLDLALMTSGPSVWSCGYDDYFHVYEVLRALGYAVRWITPQQLVAGELKAVGAVVMMDSQYVPAQAAAALADWVKAGGVLIADKWPGARDEYGRPQETLISLLGVKPGKPRLKKGKIALEESPQGYGEVTIEAIEPEKMNETITELYTQWDSDHPVARAVGSFMLSGYGYDQAIVCVAGEVVGMGYTGGAGIVLNEMGSGKTLYFPAFMGTFYDGSATRYEWDPTHSGRSFARLLDAFLKYAGVHPVAEFRHPNPRISDKVRVESPRLTPEGNVVIGLTSYNDEPVPACEVAVELPTESREFGLVLVVTGGSRKLQATPFKVEGTRLIVTLPAFDTHAAIVALKRFRPLVGLDLAGARRGAAGLIEVFPNDAIQVKATVFNPSPTALPAGTMTLFVPKGWFQKAATAAVGAVAPWGSQIVEFEVQALSRCGLTRLRPLVAKYQAGKIASTPATELVWWKNRAGK